MPETTTNNNVLTEQDRVISLFDFIKKLNELKYHAILDYKDHLWFYSISKLPDDKENIAFSYRDSAADESADSGTTILSVRKPEFHSCPEANEIFRDWLEPGWNDYRRDAQVRQALELVELKEYTDSEVSDHNVREQFSDVEERVAAFEAWQQEREKWVERQRILKQTHDLFDNLYRLYYELQKESETEEIIVANGMLLDRTNSSIQHPVLTRRVALTFDPDKNVVSVEDTEAPSELYSAVFQTMENVNLSIISTITADLQANDYHPLDRNETPHFLKVLLHQLSSDCRFFEGAIPEKWDGRERLLLSTEPYLIVRKRLDGTPKAIAQIIENIQESGEVPAPIGDLVSGGKIEPSTDEGENTLEERLAAVGGESADILLSKEANKEQLEIARRIERYNAVIVQGPPGTGKTHTIANLMGHFLAQGKSVLVTSHTQKALNVLKEKVASGLQNLCVSALDDSNLDMERSVDGITDYMSRTTSSELKKEMETLEKERAAVIARLAEVRRAIYAIIHHECSSIVLNGEGISPSEAAKFVCEHEEDLSYIPGSVRPQAPLPLSFEQLRELYQSNEDISASDEFELKCGIPNPSELLSPAEFDQTWRKLQLANDQIASIERGKGWQIVLSAEDSRIIITGGFGQIEFHIPDAAILQSIKEHIKSMGVIEPWMKSAAIDGKNSGAYRQRWITLTEQIRHTFNYANSIVEEQFGKAISILPDNAASLRDVYQRIRDTFAQKGKLSKFTLFTHKDYEPALVQASINGHPVQSVEECDIILHCIELSELRNQCAQYWNELFTPYGILPFFALDAVHPEAVAKNWIPKIERTLDWYQTDYRHLIDLLNNAVLPVDMLFATDELASDLASMERALDAIDDVLPALCDTCLAAHQIIELTEKIYHTQQILSRGQRPHSKICQAVADALKAGDPSGYADAHASLEAMYIKYDLQSKRGDLLRALKPYAPEWVEAIRSRSGIHGQATVPLTIEDAWKWKQLFEIVAEIAGQDYETLQKDSLRLSKEYREVTARYAEKSGWYHLLRRAESDLDMKQALQGWKQTVKKIGKGTGKRAPALRAEARKLMAKCQSAVPCWIMPINRALHDFNPKVNRFDIVIIDEASQSDISSLAILYLGRKLIIVGDDRQVSPMAVGMDVGEMASLQQMYLEGKIPNWHLYDAKMSIYDIAATTFQPLMLKEHFRCVPEIIGFSNMLSYDGEIKPLRDAGSSTLLPAVVNYRVDQGHREGKANVNEAHAIVALMQACMEQPEYAGKSMGVISLLGDDQVKVIQRLIEKRISPKEINSRRILCGNSANFQGDERDVIFLSVVDSGNGNGPLSMQGFGVDDAFRKRYNVAASRARDQLWVVDSLDPANDLKPGDIRKRLIDYSINPQALEIQHAEIETRAESPFEESVAKALSDQGYHLIQQCPVGAYRLDMAAVCGKKKVAVECDGERWHSGEAKIREDMERQTILERLGWRFIRIRGSEYYRDAEKTMARVIRELKSYGIEPEESSAAPMEGRETELLKRVKSKAAQILEGNPVEAIDATVAAALDPMKMIRELPKESAKMQKATVHRGEFTARSGIPKQAKLSSQKGETASTSNEITKKERLQPAKARSSAKAGAETPPRQSIRTAKKDNVKNAPEQMVLFEMETSPADAADVIDLLKKHNIPFVDRPAKGGALWVIGGPELRPIMNECKSLGVRFTYQPEGGRATRNKPGWYGKNIQGKEALSTNSKIAQTPQTLGRASKTTEQEMVSEIRFLLDVFQTGEWSQSAIAGHPLTVSRELDAACEAAGTMTDKELEACLLADMTELAPDADVLDLLRNDPQKVKRDPNVLERLETLFKAYRKAENREEQEEKAGELMEEVLSLLSEANLL